MNRFVLAISALLCAVLAASPVSARSRHPSHHHAAGDAAALPGQRQYVVIQDFNPRLFERAVRTARDSVHDGQIRDFRIILAARGVLLAIPPITSVQREVSGILRASPRIHLVACQEVVSALAKAAHRPPPLLPSTHVMSCNGMHAAMERAGWEPAPGF